MTRSILSWSLRLAVAIPTLLLALSSGSLLFAQEPAYGGPDTSSEQAPPPLSPSELTNLVAPIALYPDPLLGQVLVVSTYPQELVDAEEWLQQNGNLQGRELMYAAQQQNWDPSVQALVAFPDVMALLTRDIQWTADLGQAFLAQPSDVMNAIQYLRAQARDNGQLADTPELAINTEVENGQSAIEIQPANPQIMYVPAYNPYEVWGPPAAGAYPELPYQGSGFGSLFESAVNLAGMFAGFSGLLGGNGWGWALSWLAHTLFINNSFFSDFGFRGVSGGYGGSPAWVHNTGRGFGGSYGNGFAAGRDGGGRSGRPWAAGPFAGNGGGWRSFAGGSRIHSGAQSGAAFAPRRSAGGGNSHWGNRAANSRDWGGFRGSARAPAYQGAGRFAPRSWTGNREFPQYNRFARTANPIGSGNYRTPATHWWSRRRSDRGFSAFRNDNARSAPRAFRQSGESWGRSSRFSEPRMNSRRSFWSRGSSAPRSPKPPHFRAPHFSAPHFKSHGSGHSSRGHSGGKSRHR